jgi:hypothetical protein
MEFQRVGRSFVPADRLILSNNKLFRDPQVPPAPGSYIKDPLGQFESSRSERLLVEKKASGAKSKKL